MTSPTEMSDRDLLLGIRGDVKALREALYGGLGVGDIATIMSQLSQHHSRLVSLEAWRWRLTGAIMLGVVLAGVGGGAVGAWVGRLVS